RSCPSWKACSPTPDGPDELAGPMNPTSLKTLTSLTTPRTLTSSRRAPMSFPRRTALTVLPLAALITGAVAGCNPDRNSPVGSGDEDSLRFSWWGNPERAETTQAVIDLFRQPTPERTIRTEPGDGSGYIARLAPPGAARQEAGVTTMCRACPTEYAAGALMPDLDTVSEHLVLSEMDLPA